MSPPAIPIRILIVEDEPVVARDLTTLLRQLGYTPVGHAREGAVGIALADELRPDLVLMDIQLPGLIDGIAAAQVIRDQFNLPVVFLTAFAEDETIARAKIAEPFGYILKPFSERELQTTLQLALYKYSADVRLKASEARLRLVIAASRDGVWDQNLVKPEFFYSDRWREILGYAPHELPATTELFHQLTHPDDLARAEAHFLQRVQGTDTHYEFELRLRHKAGHYVPILACGIFVRDAHGRAIRAVGTTTDLTEQKRHEKEKSEIEVQLRQSQKMEAIGQLSGGIAHDFNNLLSAILLYTGLLQDTHQPEQTHREQLGQVILASKRAASLTRQLLLFSRRDEPLRQAVDLNEIIHELFTMLRRLLSENIDLRLDLAPAPQLIHADAGMMEQILLNLTVNAHDAMRHGGKLTLRTSPVSFPANSAGRRAGDFTCLLVRDEGCGMTPEVIAHMFEPFFTTKEVGKGTGLGLATVYNAVRSHDGWIEVESQPGAGTTFRIYLPWNHRPPLVAGPTSAAQSKSNRGSETILVVEDDPILRRVLNHSLEHSGYRVLSCATGESAVDVWLAHREEIALVITDHTMPGRVNGLELIQQLIIDRPTLRAILTSGYNPSLQRALKQLGSGIAFYAKPFEPDALLATIRASLDRTRE